MERIAAYIIHLERATDRAAQVAWLTEALPMPVEVLPAVDARTEGAAIRARYDPALGWEPPYPFPLNDTEIAVFESHRKAWARIVEGGHEAGLILEDDIWLDPERFPQGLALALDNLGENQWVRFPQFDKEAGGEVVAEEGGMQLVRPKAVALGMLVQLVHRTAAARLLDVTERFDRPVDGVMQMTWQTGVDTLAVLPAPVREISADLGGSTLRKRKGTLARLRAEIQRAVYRGRLAARVRREPGA